jgi:DNA-nicking Smr family endonuclease
MGKNKISEEEIELFNAAIENLDITDNTFSTNSCLQYSHYSKEMSDNCWHGAEDKIEFTKFEPMPKSLLSKKVKIDDKIDLHGMNIADAADELDHFIASAQASSVEILLVIHGKGDKYKSILKSTVAEWLRYDARVSAFKSAPPYHGGTGALYVQIKQQKVNNI